MFTLLIKPCAWLINLVSSQLVYSDSQCYSGRIGWSRAPTTDARARVEVKTSVNAAVEAAEFRLLAVDVRLALRTGSMISTGVISPESSKRPSVRLPDCIL